MSFKKSDLPKPKERWKPGRSTAQTTPELGQFIEDLGEDTLIAELTAHDLLAWHQRYPAKAWAKKVSGMFRWALGRGWIAEDYTVKLAKPDGDGPRVQFRHEDMPKIDSPALLPRRHREA